MYRLKKNIFISGKAYKIDDVVELDNITISELSARGIIEKVEPVSEVSIKPKRIRKEK